MIVEQVDLDELEHFIGTKMFFLGQFGGRRRRVGLDLDSSFVATDLVSHFVLHRFPHSRSCSKPFSQSMTIDARQVNVSPETGSDGDLSAQFTLRSPIVRHWQGFADRPHGGGCMIEAGYQHADLTEIKGQESSTRLFNERLEFFSGGDQ